MNYFSILAALSIALFSSSSLAKPLKEYTDEELSKVAIITPGYMTSWEPNYPATITKIDGNGLGFFDSSSEQAVEPGRHVVTIGAYHLSRGNIDVNVECRDTKGGYVYKVSQNNCAEMGVSVAADRFFKAEAEKAAAEREKLDSARYTELKSLLQSPRTAEELKGYLNTEFSRTQGIFRDDPEGLRTIVDRQLKPFLDEEKRLKKIEEARLAKEEAARVKRVEAERLAQAKEEAARAEKERKDVAAYQKSLKDGDDTNCGPVIEAKGKLVKVAFAVSGFGNEHWIRRSEIFPSGYGCRFVNGQYIPPK